MMETVEQAAQGKCQCPIPGNVQGFESPGLAKDGYSHGRTEQVGLDVLQWSLSTQTIS